jgi:SAM-dependent methyltransferase
MYKHNGFCPVCDRSAKFEILNSWLRDYYICVQCGSIPRERAVMHVLESSCPNWRQVRLHESSPVMRSTSLKLACENMAFIATQFLPGVKLGAFHDGWRNENLEAMTFADESIDVHITQDVFEHLFHPDLAFREIARTLAPGGLHIFTTPLVNKTAPSEQCACLLQDGSIEHLKPPEFHGNPVSSEGALVTMHWGYDICKYIFQASGLFTTIYHFDIPHMGMRAEYLEVLVSQKGGAPLAIPNHSPKNALIFGASTGGIKTRRFLGVDWTVHAFLDNDISKHGKIIEGSPVVPVFRIHDWPEAIIFVASVHSGEMVGQLSDIGVTSDRIRVVHHEILAAK